MNEAQRYVAKVQEAVRILNRSGLPAAAVRAAMRSILPGGEAFGEFIKECQPKRQESFWANRVESWCHNTDSDTKTPRGASCAASVREYAALNRAGVDEPPTLAQKEAGNYAKRKLSFQGLPISIENEKDSDRFGVDKNGKRWSVAMPAHYGYIRRTEGVDGDHVDVYVGPNGESDRVFIIEQVNADNGKFDEHKCMVGFDTDDDAKNVYFRAFSDGRGPDRLGKMSSMSMAEFKEWLKDFKVSNRKFSPWIAVDLDGTLAVQDDAEFQPDKIGAVIEPMRNLVLRLTGEGKTVKIFTARAASPENIPSIKRWLAAAGLPELEVTNLKDPGMVALYDDRAIAVKKNTGEVVGGEEALANMMAANFGWLEEKHPRDAAGRFTSKDGGSEPPRQPEAQRPAPQPRVRQVVRARIESIPVREPAIARQPSLQAAPVSKPEDGASESDQRSHSLANEISSSTSRTSTISQGRHTSHAVFVTYKTADGKEKRVVFKPVSGEVKGQRQNIDIAAVPAANRELASFDVAGKMGIKFPDVAEVNLDGQRGTAMRWIEGNQLAERDRDRSFNIPENRLVELAALDFITGNTDRHAGNVMVGNDGEVYPIDHGLTFPESSRSPAHPLGLGGNMSEFISRSSRLGSGGVRRMEQLIEKIDTPEFKEFLRNTAVKRGLKPESAELAVNRTEFLVNTFKSERTKNPNESIRKTFVSVKEKGWWY